MDARILVLVFDPVVRRTSEFDRGPAGHLQWIGLTKMPDARFSIGASIRHFNPLGS
jgi:hypothetical protein